MYVAYIAKYTTREPQKRATLFSTNSCFYRFLYIHLYSPFLLANKKTNKEYTYENIQNRLTKDLT